MVGIATNAWQTKQNKLKENTLELGGCYDQLSHNTCGRGDGATTNKLLRRGKTKLFKCAEPCINPLLLLSQSPFDNKDGRSSNNTNGGWKKDIKINGSSRVNWFSLVQPQPLSEVKMIGGGKEPKKYSNFVKACANFHFKLVATSSTIEQQH